MRKDTLFERDLDDVRGHRLNNLVTYTSDSVYRYRAESVESLLNDTSKIVEMIRHHHDHQVPRLNVLEDYYLGNNTTIRTGKRRVEEDKTDHRIRHGIASILSNFLNSYVLSVPIKIQGASDEFQEVLDTFNYANDIDSHNIEIGRDQNNFGRAYELLHRNEADVDKIYLLDPRTVFLIHDLTVRARVIAGVRYYPIDHNRQEYKVELYTFEDIVEYSPLNLRNDNSLRESDRIPHAFNGVPIVEYRSDRYRMGTFEQQISLIDAYDSAQSDTANYMSDFNDAILAIYGRIENAGDTEYIRSMKDMNIMILVPEDNQMVGGSSSVTASYLTKSYDVAGVEAYKSRLKEDIYTTGNIPNLSDEAFAGNQSGEALKYKLFGLQQKKNDKEKFMAKGLRVRYALLENVSKNTMSISQNSENPLEFQFTENLPRSFMEELEKFYRSGGKISQKTMLTLPSFVDDPETEMERLREEAEEAKNLYSFDVMEDDNART